MKMKVFEFGKAILLTALGLSLSVEAEAPRIELGVQAGFSDRTRFTQYELAGGYPLPWNWEWSGWRLATRAHGTTGALIRQDVAGFLGTTGAGIYLGRAGGRVWLDGGTGPAILSRENFGTHGFGTFFQFASHGGVTFQTGRFSSGYRFQHISNAGLARPNPGLNMHLFRIGYRF